MKINIFAEEEVLTRPLNRKLNREAIYIEKEKKYLHEKGKLTQYCLDHSVSHLFD